jgi:hypothetical protein
MTDADLFREYAKEAIRESTKAKSKSEMLAFNELALTWAQAALASEQKIGSSFNWSPPYIGEASPLTRS